MEVTAPEKLTVVAPGSKTGNPSPSSLSFAIAPSMVTIISALSISSLPLTPLIVHSFSSPPWVNLTVPDLPAPMTVMNGFAVKG